MVDILFEYFSELPSDLQGCCLEFAVDHTYQGRVNERKKRLDSTRRYVRNGLRKVTKRYTLLSIDGIWLIFHPDTIPHEKMVIGSKDLYRKELKWRNVPWLKKAVCRLRLLRLICLRLYWLHHLQNHYIYNPYQGTLYLDYLKRDTCVSQV